MPVLDARLSVEDALLYVSRNHLDKPYREHHCHFCDDQFRPVRGCTLDDGLYSEEVGEFWSVSMRQTVLAHPDCTPMGIDATVYGEDPEWKMA